MDGGREEGKVCEREIEREKGWEGGGARESERERVCVCVRERE